MAESIRDMLFKLQDLKYRDFTAKLIPTINREVIIGVRTPALRKLAKEISKKDADAFIQQLPHKYFEENNLHGYLIANYKDFEGVIGALEEFLPYIDNWSTCDTITPKIFKKNTDRLLPYIDKWLNSSESYRVRFAIRMLMAFYLDEKFKPEYLGKVAAVRSEEYYVNMMIAWYFATALAKQYDQVITYIEKKKLDTWTHNKTIQKAIESYRISTEQKEYLRTLKVKKS